MAVSEYLTSNIEADFMVLESSSYDNGLLKKLFNKKIRYSFQEDNDPILYRTKLLNQMASQVETPYFACWDADVIIPIGQIAKAVELLRNNMTDFVYPYEELFLDTSLILRKLFLIEKTSLVLEKNIKKMAAMYLPNPLGGVFLARLDKYKEAGLENENFYGWGMEDGDRYYRWINMGYRVNRIHGPLFHLSHVRGINSQYHNEDQKFIKEKMVLNVKRNKENG
ncbi:MAG: hypothetical protein KK926_03925 [Methanomethylovorans sp.]|nr:hypothetical protein [Methanomethylovorans sp.]